MKAESSPTQSGVEARLNLLRREQQGSLEQLPCPDCGECQVSVWYTHAAPQEFRTWFVCANCGFEMRAQNSGRPKHYSADRDRTGQGAAN